MYKSFSKNGFAIAWVVIILAVLFMLSGIVISVMKQESNQSYKQVDRILAGYAAECGIEHAIYIMQFHRNLDSQVITTTGATAKLDINKKFATSDEFEMELPVTSPDDYNFPSLASVDLNERLKKLAKDYKMPFTPKIEKITIKYKTLKSVNSSEDRLLKYGKVSIKCTASYGHVKKSIESIRRIEIYRTLSIAPDWQFAVLDDSGGKANTTIAARRIKGGSTFIPQIFMVNNGRDASKNPVPAKIYGKKLGIYLNIENSNLASTLYSLNPLSQTFISQFAMASHLTEPTVDSKIPANAKDISPLFKFKPFTFGFAHFDSTKGYLVEYDHYKMMSKSFFKSILNKGGSRGPINLTGIPKHSSNILDFLVTLLGKHDKYVENKICGNVTRLYGYYEKASWCSWLTSTFGALGMLEKLINNHKANKTVEEDYTFGIDKTTKPSNPEPYDASVYKKLAGHGNGRLFTSAKDFSDHKLSAGSMLWWKDIGGKDFKNVCWFWGWADSYKDQPADSWWKFWKWGTRNAFEAARRDPKFAINVNGCYFVDGNVFIEGYYRGRGAIVATGNIIIGGSLMRHPDDGTIDGLAGNWITEGSNNMLQLIALGTRKAEGGKPTGKIIFSPHKYDGKMFQTGMATSIFSDSKQMVVDANIWAKNGITVDIAGRDDLSLWETLWGSGKDTFISINGNVIVKNLNWHEKGAYQTWPDRLVINRFQRWVEILDMMKKSKNVVLNLFPQADNYKDYSE